NRCCVFCLYPGALPERRNRCTNDTFREPFLVDVRHIKNLETACSIRGIEIFAAQHQVLNVLSAVFMCFLQNCTVLDVFSIVVRICDLMEMTTDGRLRFVWFGPDDSV